MLRQLVGRSYGAVTPSTPLLVGCSFAAFPAAPFVFRTQRVVAVRGRVHFRDHVLPVGNVGVIARLRHQALVRVVLLAQVPFRIHEPNNNVKRLS